jgi:hypothetical protein
MEDKKGTGYCQLNIGKKYQSNNIDGLIFRFNFFLRASLEFFPGSKRSL